MASTTVSSLTPTRDDFAAMLDESFAGGNRLVGRKSARLAGNGRGDGKDDDGGHSDQALHGGTLFLDGATVLGGA